MESLTTHIPSQIPETPETLLQKHIESSLGSWLKQQVGSFQQSVMEAFISKT